MYVTFQAVHANGRREQTGDTFRGLRSPWQRPGHEKTPGTKALSVASFPAPPLCPSDICELSRSPRISRLILHDRSFEYPRVRTKNRQTRGPCLPGKIAAEPHPLGPRVHQWIVIVLWGWTPMQFHHVFLFRGVKPGGVSSRIKHLESTGRILCEWTRHCPTPLPLAFNGPPITTM